MSRKTATMVSVHHLVKETLWSSEQNMKLAKARA